eukprot:6083573-Pleurochrysis_carterae.AAC.2
MAGTPSDIRRALPCGAARAGAARCQNAALLASGFQERLTHVAFRIKRILTACNCLVLGCKAGHQEVPFRSGWAAFKSLDASACSQCYVLTAGTC